MEMAKPAISESGRGRLPPWWMAPTLCLAVTMCLALGLVLPGCGGCNILPQSKQAKGKQAKGQPAKEQQAKAQPAKSKKNRKKLLKKAKPKPDFESLKFVTLPSQPGRSDVFVKPGHWTTGAITLRANNFEFRGELKSELADSGGRSLPLADTRFCLHIKRSLALPKGQKRKLELPVFLPAQSGPARNRLSVLNPRGGSVLEDMSPLLRMPAHQFFFVVLASSPSSYQYLNRLPCILAPVQNWTEANVSRHYQVVLTAIERRLPLPATSLEWTAIAYVLWDNLDPAKLDRSQQTALVDWLHWGGQLLISGPESLDRLRGSFLEPYLPTARGSTWTLPEDALAALHEERWLWDHPRLTMRRPWTGVRLEPLPGAEVTLKTPQGEPLLVERRAGAGRVVVSAFRLSQRELADWKQTDVLFNAFLLRRFPRLFYPLNEGTFAVAWVERPTWDPRAVSRLRYYTRDSELVPGRFPAEMYAEVPSQPHEDLPYGMPGQTDPGPPYGAGVAGWNDFSAVSKLARWIVTEAAGIEVPEASFVLWFLGIYLAVLVGFNWMFFKLVGRVEWAWAAVPVIALFGGVAVIRLAQVNIGFDRSQTELDVIELQGGYPRAHVTRYLALYSSLGTRYELQFDEPTALALPAARGSGRGRAVTQGTSNVTLQRSREAGGEQVSEVRLTGLDVFSNSAELVHCEQMFELEGPLVLDRRDDGSLWLTNHTGLVLRGAGIVSADKAAWLGTVRRGQSVQVVLEPRLDLDKVPEPAPQAEQDPAQTGKERESLAAGVLGLWSERLEKHEATQFSPPRGAMNLRKLYLQAENDVPAGELRLLAWVEEGVPGLTVIPQARSRMISFVIAHLQPPDLPAPQPDASAIPNIIVQEEDAP